MLYFLLIVIAVGVLLISPAGKKILKWSAISALISGVVLGVVMIFVVIWEDHQEIAAFLLFFLVGSILRGLNKYFDDKGKKVE